MADDGVSTGSDSDRVSRRSGLWRPGRYRPRYRPHLSIRARTINLRLNDSGKDRHRGHLDR